MLFMRNSSFRLALLLNGFQPQTLLENSGADLNDCAGRFLQQYLQQVGFTEREGRRYLLVHAFVVCLGAGLGALISIPLAVFITLFLLWLCFLRLKHITLRRALHFEKDYTTFLLSFSSSIRTGLDPIIAFCSCATLFEDGSILRAEVDRFQALLEAGVREEVAVGRFASSINLPDIALLRVALILARKHGASLTVCLQRLAKVTRQRQSFRRKVHAALAMQRMSAFGISGCAVVIGIFQCITSPEGVALAYADPNGKIILSIGVALMALGLFWMIRLTKAKV